MCKIREHCLSDITALTLYFNLWFLDQVGQHGEPTYSTDWCMRLILPTWRGRWLKHCCFGHLISFALQLLQYITAVGILTELLLLNSNIFSLSVFCFARWRLLSVVVVCRRCLPTSSFVVCNAAGGRVGLPPGAWAVGRPTLHGELRLRPVRTT